MDDVTDHSAQAAAEEYGRNLVDRQQCPDDFVTVQFSNLVVAWLTGAPTSLEELGLAEKYGVAPADVASAVAFQNAPEQQKRSWFTTHYKQFATCSLSASTLAPK